MLFIFILSALIIASSLIGQDSLNFFSLKQKQLFYASRIKSRVNLATSLSMELPATNATALVRNEPVLNQTIKSIEDMTSVSDNVAIMLREDDDSYNPIVQKSLFDDGCELLNTSYCESLQKQEIKASMLSLLSRLKAILQEKIDSYLSSK